MLQVPVGVPGAWLVYETWGLLGCRCCRGLGVAEAWVLQTHIAEAGEWLCRCVGVARRHHTGRSRVPTQERDAVCFLSPKLRNPWSPRKHSNYCL